jgi:hypothetical protein
MAICRKAAAQPFFHTTCWRTSDASLAHFAVKVKLCGFRVSGFVGEDSSCSNLFELAMRIAEPGASPQTAAGDFGKQRMAAAWSWEKTGSLLIALPSLSLMQRHFPALRGVQSGLPCAYQFYTHRLAPSLGLCIRSPAGLVTRRAVCSIAAGRYAHIVFATDFDPITPRFYTFLV